MSPSFPTYIDPAGNAHKLTGSFTKTDGRDAFNTKCDVYDAQTTLA